MKDDLYAQVEITTSEKSQAAGWGKHVDVRWIPKKFARVGRVIRFATGDVPSFKVTAVYSTATAGQVDLMRHQHTRYADVLGRR